MIVVDFQKAFHLSLAYVTFAEETFGVDIVFQVLQNFNGLIRETVKFSFGKVKPVMVAGKKVIDKNQDSQDKDNDKNQIAGIDESFSFKALFENRKIENDVDCQGGYSKEP